MITPSARWLTCRFLFRCLASKTDNFCCNVSSNAGICYRCALKTADTNSQGSFMQTTLRHDWAKDEVLRLFALPFNELLFTAHSVHRQHFDPNQVQISTLLSIKTGGCAEDCGYCPQS